MFSSGANYSKLKTHLRLAVNRLKLLEKKKTELAQKSRKEIADYITQGKFERAKIRVEHIIREDYLVEGLELIEMYCDLLLSRFGLIQQGTAVDASLAEAISSIIWATPRIENDVSELRIISDQFGAKYGKKYIESCRTEQVDTISEKLKHKLGVQPPPKVLVEKYLIEIAKNYNIPYEPDLQIMREAAQHKGIDSLLFDGLPNNLDIDDASIVRPTGFVDFSQEPAANPPEYRAFNYPMQNTMSAKTSLPSNDTISPDCPLFPASQDDASSSYSFNIPPDVSSNKLNDMNEVKPSNRDNFLQSKLKPSSSANLNANINLPDLPSVPMDMPTGPYEKNLDNIDFDDLTRRFEELKKKK